MQRTMAGSEGVCLNLKAPEGQKIMHQLAAKADMPTAQHAGREPGSAPA